MASLAKRALRVTIVTAVWALVACGKGTGRGNCPEGARFCEGNVVRECLADGMSSRVVVDCSPDASCQNGTCIPKKVGGDQGADDGWVEPAPDDGGGLTPEHQEDLPPPDVHLDDASEEPTEAADIAIEDPDAKGPADETASDAVSDESGQTVLDPGVAPDLDGGAPSDARDLADTPLGCGNGRLDPGEECDGDDFGGQTCFSLGYGPGGLACRSDCTFDTLLCGPDSHRLAYEAVPNAWFKDDFVDVAWHPEGHYALLVSASRVVVRYDPDAQALQALTLVGSTGQVTPTRVAFAASGDAFVVGYDAGGFGHVLRVPDGADSLMDLPEAGQPARFISIRFHGSGEYAMIAGQSGTYSVNYLCLFDPATGQTANFKGYNASAGVTDLDWVPEGVLPAGEAVLLVHGWNGVDAKLWYQVSNEVVPTPGSLSGYGNMGRLSWRPGGLYGLVAGTSSNVLYVFSGTWDKAYLSGSGSGILDVAFRPDGRRALVLGQPFGSPVVYHILEHRPTGPAFSSSDFIPQHIANWGASPFFANSNTRLLAAAFRPKVRCDEGLIVGQDPSPSWNPSFGVVVRFRDTDARDCP